MLDEEYRKTKMSYTETLLISGNLDNTNPAEIATDELMPFLPNGKQIILKDINNKKGGLRMKIRPLYDRLIVRRVAEEEKTKGGIIIPDTAKDKPTEGEVVAAGKGRLTEDGKVIPMDVKKGDRILFSKYAGNEVKIDGTEYLIMREEDVLGIIEKK